MSVFDVRMELKESSLEERKHLSRGRGRVPDGCNAAKFLEMRDGMRGSTDGSCSRSPSCRLCPGWTPEVRALLSGPPLWKVSCNPDLTDLLRGKQTELRQRANSQLQTDNKPQQHRKMP